MSFKRRNAFLDLILKDSYPGKQLSATARWIFLLLLDSEADDYWECCFQGQQRLARRSGVSIKMVGKALRALGEAGLLYAKPRGGAGRATAYRCALPGDDLSDLGSFQPAHLLRAGKKRLGAAAKKARVLRVEKIQTGVGS